MRGCCSCRRPKPKQPPPAAPQPPAKETKQEEKAGVQPVDKREDVCPPPPARLPSAEGLAVEPPVVHSPEMKTGILFERRPPDAPTPSVRALRKWKKVGGC